MSDGGKGSKPRPYSISQNQFAQNWDRIFGKKELHKIESFNEGDQRINAEGKLEEFSEGYWQEIENRR